MESGWPPPGPPCAQGLSWAGLHGAGCSVSSQGQQPCGVRGQPCPLLSPGPFRGPISKCSHGGVKASAPEVQGARTSSPDRASRGGVTWGLVFSSRGRSMPCFSGPARDLPEVGVSWDIRSHRFGSAGVGPPPRTKARPPAGQHPRGMGPCVGFAKHRAGEAGCSLGQPLGSWGPLDTCAQERTPPRLAALGPQNGRAALTAALPP